VKQELNGGGGVAGGRDAKDRATDPEARLENCRGSEGGGVAGIDAALAAGQDFTDAAVTADPVVDVGVHVAGKDEDRGMVRGKAPSADRFVVSNPVSQKLEILHAAVQVDAAAAVWRKGVAEDGDPVSVLVAVPAAQEPGPKPQRELSDDVSRQVGLSASDQLRDRPLDLSVLLRAAPAARAAATPPSLELSIRSLAANLNGTNLCTSTRPHGRIQAASGTPLNTSRVCQATWIRPGSTVPGRGRSSWPCRL
jgi:hypothetical protein